MRHGSRRFAFVLLAMMPAVEWPVVEQPAEGETMADVQRSFWQSMFANAAVPDAGPRQVAELPRPEEGATTEVTIVDASAGEEPDAGVGEVLDAGAEEDAGEMAAEAGVEEDAGAEDAGTDAGEDAGPANIPPVPLWARLPGTEEPIDGFITGYGIGKGSTGKGSGSGSTGDGLGPTSGLENYGTGIGIGQGRTGTQGFGTGTQLGQGREGTQGFGTGIGTGEPSSLKDWGTGEGEGPRTGNQGFGTGIGIGPGTTGRGSGADFWGRRRGDAGTR